MPLFASRGLPPQRRILFIEKAFQLRFIAKVTAVVVLGTALTGGLLYLLADKEFGRAFYSAHYQARSSWELLLPAVLAASFLSMCIVAMVAVVLTLYDSHRIGGPMYRFRANLETIAGGDLTLVTHLRDGDELRALTEAMNGMTQSLRDKVLVAGAATRELGAALEAAQQACQAGDPVEAEHLSRLARCREELAAALGAFRV
ncbi:MAG TPA: methyl-accepting chemotaxis protein [Deferrisomatales bacterium]|nr:methyl-accepting chemotaxis protein [Deferrisomatales bacterium]